MPSVQHPTLDDRVTTLETSLYGAHGRGGLSEAVEDLSAQFRELRSDMGRMYMAVVAAALSFGFGSIAVVVTLIMTAR